MTNNNCTGGNLIFNLEDSVINNDKSHPLNSNSNLREVVLSGSLDLTDNKDVRTLVNIISIGGDLITTGSSLTNFGKLKHIKGNLILTDSIISELYTDDSIRKSIKIDGEIIR